MNKPYLEKLQNPKWLKKNLKILKRDDFKCTACGSDKKLQVHHTFYYADYRNPWEYPDYSLITVCDKCHREYHAFNEITIKSIPKKPKKIVYKKPKKKTNPNRKMSLKELYRIWEPRMKKKGKRYYF